MKTLLKIIIIIVASVSVISCDKFSASTPCAKEISLLPGECLISNELIHHLNESDAQVFDAPFLINTGFNAFNIEEPLAMSIAFDMNLKTEKEILSVINENGKVAEYRYRPSNVVYQAFGDDKRKVEKEYEVYYEAFKNAPNRLSHDAILTTVYSFGEIVLKANAPFCGIPAGENLSSLAYIFDDPKAYQVALPDIDIPLEYKPLGKCFGIRIPIGDYKLVDENVTFNLEIPVKVGLLLNYLKEKENNPNAQMQFRDEVLTCVFTINKGLR